jgi:hypothetical protein
VYGIVTRNEPELTWSAFDRAFYQFKEASGRASEPVSTATNVLSCFGDNAAVEGDPTLAQASEEGVRATKETAAFDRAHVCPTHEEYRRGLLEMVEDAADASGNVRLDDVMFAGEGFCHCDRCTSQFEDSAQKDWVDWRATIITDFLRAARERIPGKMVLTLEPDPYPSRLYRQSGIDLEAIEAFVDEFVVPLYDPSYETTYWVEAISGGFVDRLETPLSVELYAVDMDINSLIAAIGAVDDGVKSILLGYDASTAQAALRRMRADRRDGESHGPSD